MKENKTDIGGMTRRSFAFGTGGAVVLLAMGGLKFVPVTEKIRPPGGQDEDHLISACVRCQRCVEACPKDALVPAKVEGGILGARLPTFNFNSGWCDFCKEENGGEPLCVAACPTGALRLEEGATAKTTIIGKATINNDWCLAWVKYNGCRFCYDACEFEAIEIDEYARPYIVTEQCCGCGACQNVCVSLKEGSLINGAEHRAAYVVPLSESEA